tara:strand:+ start:5476 stop:6162 length:687 start_codon:yes stop_codon:yes gene_type:complete
MILSWQQIPSPLISEIMCHNFDGVVLDTEHGCYSNETLYSCIQVIKCSEKKCFVRLTEVSNTMIRYCLDAGVDGLIFSSVETREQCEKIIEYCYYSPKGKRGLGLVRQNMWGEKDLIQPSPIIIPQIETKTAVDNLKEITQFSFDYYLIGPYDLSLSLNVPGKFDKPEFTCYIDKVYDSIPKEKIAVHIPNDVKNELLKYKDCGLKCLGMDTIALINYNKEILNYVEF